MQAIMKTTFQSSWARVIGGVIPLALLAQSVVASPATAQQHPTPSATHSQPSVDSAAAAAMVRARPSADSATVMRRAAVADTGRMTPGYRDLSRYNTPGYCAAAVRGLREQTWRRNEQVDVIPGSVNDTLPTVAVTIGKRCLAALPDAEHTEAAELPNLFVLAMLVGDSARMESAVTRQATIAPTAEARGYAYSDAIAQLAGTAFPSLVSHPRYLTVANALMARLDALGTGARVPRLLAHTQLRTVAEGAQFDTTALLREDKAIHAIVPLLTADEKKAYDNDLSMTLYDSLIIVWYQRRPNLPVVVRGLLDRYLAAYPGAFTQDQASAVIAWVVGLASKVGQPAPPITGKYWYPASAPHAQPVPGKVTLVMRVEKDGGFKTERTAMLERLYSRYHDRGFDVVLVLKTQGFSWSSPPQTPDDEAKTIAWYYYDHLQLPFKLVVDETPFTTQPDGRKVPGMIDFERQYFPAEALIGRDGRIYSTWIGLESEAQLNAFIEQALAQPAPAQVGANAGGASGAP